MTSATLDPAAGHAAAKPPVAALKQDAAIIGLVGLAHGSSHFGHLLLPPLFPIFMKEFGLNFSELGLLVSLFFIISGVGQACSGFLVDRIGARPVMFGSLVLFLLACLAAASANGYAGLFLAAALAGAGNAPFHPVDFTILNQRVSPSRLAYGFSVHGLSGNLGWALSPVFLVFIRSFSNWRMAYVGAAVFYLLIIAILFVHRDKLRTETVVRKPEATVGDDFAFMKLPVVWWCFGFFFLSTMTIAVVQSFGASILKAVHGASFEAATYTITAYMLCGAVGVFAGGFVAARQASHSDRVVAISMTAGAVLLALCATGWLGGMGTMVVLAVTGFAVGVGGPSRDLMIKKATPKGATGRVYGMVYSGLDTGFAASPALFGLFMDRGWYGATLAGAALVLLLSVGAAIGVGRRTAHG